MELPPPVSGSRMGSGVPDWGPNPAFPIYYMSEGESLTTRPQFPYLQSETRRQLPWDGEGFLSRCPSLLGRVSCAMTPLSLALWVWGCQESPAGCSLHAFESKHPVLFLNSLQEKPGKALVSFLLPISGDTKTQASRLDCPPPRWVGVSLGC